MSSSLRHDRESAVALLFAIMAIPIIGLVGLAIDYGMWNQTYASLSLAASGAALNAVKTAAAAALINDPNAVTLGQAAGQQWFVSQVGLGANAAHLNLLNLSPADLQVTVTTGVTTTATVTYNSNRTGGYVSPIFGHLFGATQYPLYVTATAAIGTAPYLDVEILLDDSPSMQIGATPNDIAYLMALTTCQAPGAAIPKGATSNLSGQEYSAYYYASGYNAEAAELSAPFGSGDGGIVGIGAPLPGGMIEYQPYPCPQAATPGATAGPPCAFACHFDNSRPAGQGKDFFEAARATIVAGQQPCAATSSPQNCNIMLRFDLVKSAVNQVIATMQTDDLPIANLKVGVFSFSDAVTQAYPVPGMANCGTPGSEACQAGDDWATAQQLVGTYPTGAGQPEPGIQPAYTPPSGNTGYTDFPNVMTTLYQQYLTTKSGDGTSAASPAKVLFLVTDGVGDYVQGGTRIYPPFDPSLCDYYKNSLGYQVYVVYTPYYSLMNNFYLLQSPIASLTYPLLTSTVATNLRACTSNPNTDFVVANPNDYQSISAALQRFLQLALMSAARFTQ